MIERVIQVKITAPPGFGKTVLALAIKKALQRLGVEVLHENNEMNPTDFAEYERTCEEKMAAMGKGNDKSRVLVAIQEELAFDHTHEV
jgi:signal recognition particle subunit SEC65